MAVTSLGQQESARGLGCHRVMESMEELPGRRKEARQVALADLGEATETPRE